jgi:hypothetical protein
VCVFCFVRGRRKRLFVLLDLRFHFQYEFLTAPLSLVGKIRILLDAPCRLLQTAMTKVIATPQSFGRGMLRTKI